MEKNKMDLGAAEARTSNVKYVNIRIGKIAQTANEQLPEYVPAKTVNASGVENHFFARPFDNITGYVDDIRWREHTLTNGTVLTGWNISINTGTETFVLEVGSLDRPFESTMNSLCSVDFTKPVRFVGFMGTNKDKSKKQKVLLLTQSGEEKDWVHGKYEMKFLSQLIIKKLKEKVPLTDDEKRNVAYLPDGKVDGEYPYIKEKLDGKWSFEAWREFLMGEMYTHVIPAVEIAKDERGDITFSGPASAEPVVVVEEDPSDFPF
jgi:hypothetical protein